MGLAAVQVQYGSDSVTSPSPSGDVSARSVRRLHTASGPYLSASAGAPALAGLGRLTVPAAPIDHEVLSMPPPGIVGSYAPEGPAPKARTLPTKNLALAALHDVRRPLMVTGTVRLPQLLTLNHDGIRCRLLGPKLLKVNT